MTPLAATAGSIAGCVLLAVALRAPYFGVPLGVDEGGIAYIAQAWPGGHASLYGAYWLDRPPLLVVAFKLAVVGGDAGVRALGALAAAVLVVTVGALGRLIAGDQAARSAALVAALLGGSVALGAVYTPGELLAVVPASLSVLGLVLAHRRREARWLVAAGALAVSAALVKQSGLDAGLAGITFLAASAVQDHRFDLRRWMAYGAGCALPLAVVAVWQVTTARGVGGGLVYALFGFRLNALHVLAGSNLPLHARLTHLAVPALASGLVLALGGTVIGLRHLRGDRVIALTMVAWLAGATVGVLGGGSYWSHYLIQLIPVCSIATAVALAAAPPRVRLAVLSGAALVAAATALGAVWFLAAHPQRRPELAVAGYVRANARLGDSQYVMYARANIAYYDGLPTPYPYAWSLMIRAVPGARAQLRRTLNSDARPTWIIGWQSDDRWNLDEDGAMDRILARRYRRVTTVCGHPIYLRTDRRRPSAAESAACS